MRQYLIGDDVVTAFERGWATLRNGELLSQAEAAGFEALVTTDKSLRYQQNLAVRQIAILVLSTTSWRRIAQVSSDVLSAVDGLAPGAYVEVHIP